MSFFFSAGGNACSLFENELGGIPSDVPLVAINRQCSSGLQAIATIAGAIQQGTIDAGIGAGVESMSMWGFDAGVNLKNLSESIVDCAEARDCMIPMGITSENVSAKFGISRVSWTDWKPNQTPNRII